MMLSSAIFVQSMPNRNWIFFFFKPLPRNNVFLLTRPDLPVAAAALATTPFFLAGFGATALTVLASYTNDTKQLVIDDVRDTHIILYK